MASFLNGIGWFLLVCPVFAIALEIHFSIQEELKLGTEVYSFRQKAIIAENLTESQSKTLHFFFLEDTSDQRFFALNATEGVLTIAKRLDRDSICTGSTCDLIFNIAGSSDPLLFVISFTISVTDINDNSPKFPYTSWLLEIPENSKPNSVYEIPSATDNDTSPEFSIASYSYSPVSPIFTLNESKKLDGGFVVQLQVLQSLDREEKSFYQFHIMAKDGGPNPNTGYMLVNLSVSDVNDNPPVFDQKEYNKTVRENATLSSSIIQVRALDKDSGENGRVTYRIVTVEVTEQFRMDADTGDIYLLKPLKYTGQVYRIIIEASDHGDIKKVAQVQVNIDVEDAINNAPVVKVNILSGPADTDTVYMQESANPGAFVAFVRVDDPDVGENKRVACQTSNEYFQVEEMTNGYKVIVKQKLDREKQVEHLVNVTCHDFGDPYLYAWDDFRVIVNDTNDNKPIFTKDVYTATILERNNVSDRVLKVEATDADEGFNAQVTYHLDSQAGTEFSIIPATGVIQAMEILDREATPQFSFNVLAVDHGNPALTGEALVILTVLDVNDNSPEFNRSIYYFEVKENLIELTSFGQVSADDDDTGENARLTYFMAPEDEDAVPFMVLPNGAIQTTRILDREAKSQYSFVVYAQDHGDSPRNDSARVTVYVLDDNDNDPIIAFPNKRNHTVWSISGTSLPITTIQAHDQDEGVNKKLNFYIHSGNEKGAFVLHPESGELFLNENYHFTTDFSTDLVICVRDSGMPVRSKCAQLITIISINNNTAAALTEGKSNSYITISIAVVIVTIVVSVAIILTIVFLKRMDSIRNKRNFNSNGPLGVPMPNAYSPSSSQQDMTNDFKERQSDLNSSTSQGEKMSDKEKGMFDIMISEKKCDGFYNQLNPQQLQYLQKSSQSQMGVSGRHPDNDSDMSAETIPSDSGKGGSEEDVPSHMADESRSFDGHSYADSIRKEKQFNRSQHQNLKTNPPRPPPISQPITQIGRRPRPVSSTPDNNKHVFNDVWLMNNSIDHVHSPSAPPLYDILQSSSHSNLSRGNLDKVKGFNVSTWDYLRPNHFSSHRSMHKDRDYISLRPESLSTLRSRDEDDDGNTTTSGSYTLDQEDIDCEIIRHKDLVV